MTHDSATVLRLSECGRRGRPASATQEPLHWPPAAAGLQVETSAESCARVLINAGRRYRRSATARLTEAESDRTGTVRDGWLTISITVGTDAARTNSVPGSLRLVT